jgi:periplasmic copper chaperone A
MHARPVIRTVTVAAAVTLAGGALAACGDDDGGGAAATTTIAIQVPTVVETTAATTTPETTDATASVEVTDVWARTSPMNARMGAAYMNLTASDDDALVGVMVDPSVANMAEIHETTEKDGQMQMQEVGTIDLPAGEQVELKPGGYHVMLMQLAAPLEEGQTFELTLMFENAGEQVVDVAVRSS